MKPQPFLVAASETQEYDWILLPSSIPSSARGEVLHQLPSKVTPELALVNLNFAGRSAFAAVRTERTVSPQGNPVRDESGRLLRHTFGAVFDRPIDQREAESEVDRITPQVKEALAAFLDGPGDAERPPGEVSLAGMKISGAGAAPQPGPRPAPTPPERPRLPPEDGRRSRLGFNPWLAIGAGLAVFAAAALWDLSLLGRVTTLKARAAETQKENHELEMRLLNADEMIKWVKRAPCQAQ